VDILSSNANLLRIVLAHESLYIRKYAKRVICRVFLQDSSRTKPYYTSTSTCHYPPEYPLPSFARFSCHRFEYPYALFSRCIAHNGFHVAHVPAVRSRALRNADTLFCIRRRGLRLFWDSTKCFHLNDMKRRRPIPQNTWSM
jgi:hypothetical protein